MRLRKWKIDYICEKMLINRVYYINSIIRIPAQLPGAIPLFAQLTSWEQRLMLCERGNRDIFRRRWQL